MKIINNKVSIIIYFLSVLLIYTNAAEFPFIQELIKSSNLDFKESELSLFLKSQLNEAKIKILGENHNSILMKPNKEEFDGELIEKRILEPSLTEEVIELIRANYNVMVVFHAHWCGHCKNFLPILEKISNNAFVKNWKFVSVQCTGGTICDDFNVKKYPTIKVFSQGQEANFEPSRDYDVLLETLLKIEDSRIIKIKSLEDLSFYNKYFGSISFLIYEVEKNENFLNCVNNIQKSLEVNPFVYFGHIELEQNNSIDFSLLKSTLKLDDPNKKNGIIISGSTIEKFQNELRLYQNVEYSNFESCKTMKNFIIGNQFPIFKNLSVSYLKRLQMTNYKMMILVVNTYSSLIVNEEEIKESSILNSLKSIDYLAGLYHKNNFLKMANDQEQILYSFLDLNSKEDSKILEYFQITSNDIPSIIYYDFSKKKYYSDKKQLTTIQDFIIREQIILKSISEGKFFLVSGNYLEDFFYYFGIELTSTSLMILLLLLFSLLIASIFFLSKACEVEKKISIKKIPEPSLNSKSKSTSKEKKKLD